MEKGRELKAHLAPNHNLISAKSGESVILNVVFNKKYKCQQQKPIIHLCRTTLVAPLLRPCCALVAPLVAPLVAR